MRKLLLGPLLIVCVALGARADDKKKDDAKIDAKKADEEKLIPVGRLDGILKKSGGSGEGLTVTVELILPDPRAQLEQLKQQQELMLALSIRNPLLRQQALVQVLQQMRGGQNAVIRKNVDLDLEPADEMVVRTMFLPEKFDDKGKPKKYTAKELKELRGPDASLPGYSADNDSLKDGQIVTVYLVRKKRVPAIKAAPKDKEKKDKDNEKLWDDDNKPKVRMIVIRAEPT
jgi:hypothetical protein